MSRLKDFPSIHDRIHTGYSNALHSLYEIGRNLSDKERQEVIARVRAKGYRVEELEFYEYAPTDTMRHLFVRMEGEAESIPYFMLDKECWVSTQFRASPFERALFSALNRVLLIN